MKAEVGKRDVSGQYQAHTTCEFCRGKVAGDYCSDEDTCNQTGLGLVLCDRVRCTTKREKLSIADRLAVYRSNQ